MSFPFFPSFGRKAQGMSLNVVVVVVIALVIMIVLIFVFTGKTKLFGKATASCEAKGGQCKPSCSTEEVSHLATNCAANEDENKKCCVRFYEEPAKAPAPAPTPAPAAGGANS